MNRTIGCRQVSLLVYRYDLMCRMKVPTIEQKKIAAKDGLLVFALLDTGTRSSVSSAGKLPLRR